MDINWFLAAPGAGLLAWAARQLYGGWASRRWPVARGRVVDTEITEQRAPRGGWLYAPAVRYHYRVGGATLTGARLRFGAPWLGGAHSAAADELAGCAPGREVAVYYNPRNAADAVLRPGVPRGALVGAALGVGLLAAGVRG